MVCRRRRLDQLNVGANDVGVERHGAVALSLEVGGQLIALARQRLLDPLEAADRAAVAGAAGEHRAPGVEHPLLLGRVAHREGSGADREDGGEGAAAPVFDDADLLGAVGDRDQLQLGELGWQRGLVLRLALARLPSAAARRGRAVAAFGAPTPTRPAPEDRRPLLRRAALDRYADRADREA